MAPKETPKMKQRPIVRLGILIISHSVVVSVICCISGVVALLLLPILAKNTYISENALMPGSANPMLSDQDVGEANKLVNALLDLKSEPISSGRVSTLVAEFISDLGAEVGYHKFYPESNQFHPLHFFSLPDSGSLQENVNCSMYGINVIGIARAPQGDGKEAVVLVTPYNSENADLSDALSIGLTYSVFSLLTQVTWLAKDIIWLVADSRYGEYSSVSAWLRDYQRPVFGASLILDSDTCDGGSRPYDLNNFMTCGKLIDNFKRAGTMAAALVVKVTEKSEPFVDTLNLYAEASNGQMPNLDLINIVNYLAVHRQGLHVKVKKLIPLLNAKWLNVLADILETVGVIFRRLNPQWKFGIPAAEYIDGTATLASSLYYQALGIPTGPHGAFRDYQVDAVTLEFSPYSLRKGRHKEFLLQGSRLIEGVIRSVNNLLEKFHQSFFLYLLTSPGRFVSVGVYMIPFILLVAPLPVMAASLYMNIFDFGPNTETGQLAVSPRSVTWLDAAKMVLIVHFWGAIVSLLPYCICQMDFSTPTMNLAIWSMLSALCFLLLCLVLGLHFNQTEKAKWVVLKSATLSAVFIGLCLMSVVNFATAEIGALLLVPLCLMIHPLKINPNMGTLVNFSRMALNFILLSMAFPPVSFFLLQGAVYGFHGIDIGDFWMWVESLWAWNSATYLYITMIHLPCWVLCLHILLHAR
ncbi:hypothetical protein SAY87_021626 [Trapa incisa]|uniref:Glycosylphosphatidylinositol anchor attachment 1 protein n=1 Tax=Trapa incisa TaxID=236973 RepID=A0AAN7JXC7_9MYRT|nr:hypothetical protein SAY87_021626 [Trapa incisa]